MLRNGLAPLILLLATTALSAEDKVPEKNFCLEGIGCSEDKAHLFDEAKLLTLSCEPLWVIRNAIHQAYGLCIKNDFNRQFFSQDCLPSPKNANEADDKVEVWEGILRIARVERLKGCVR